MSDKAKVEVVIGGKVFMMSGYESEIHIQRVASHINRKLQEFESMREYRALPGDMRATLIQINIADELIKAQDQIEQLKADLRLKEDELANVKHDLVELQMRMEKAEGHKKR